MHKYNVLKDFTNLAGVLVEAGTTLDVVDSEMNEPTVVDAITELIANGSIVEIVDEKKEEEEPAPKEEKEEEVSDSKEEKEEEASVSAPESVATKMYRGHRIMAETSRTVERQTFNHITLDDGTEHDLTAQEYEDEVK